MLVEEARALEKREDDIPRGQAWGRFAARFGVDENGSGVSIAVPWPIPQRS